MKKSKKLIVTIIVLSLILIVGYFISGQKNKSQKVIEPIKTPIPQTETIEEDNEKIYFSDGYYYHRVIDCSERKRNMSESIKFSKRGCELYGDKPCPKCCPEEYKEYIDKNK